MKVLLLDNYDSFTYNLYHLLEPVLEQVDVVLNDRFDVGRTTDYDAIVFSPGPGLPVDSGVMSQIIERFHREIPMLGVCLGMQAMVQCFGGKLKNLPDVLHGVPQQCLIQDADDPLYKNLPAQIQVGHYHSWIVNDVPENFTISAIHPDGWPVSVTHKTFPLCAVQYHPESILTPHGESILRNWVNFAVAFNARTSRQY